MTDKLDPRSVRNAKAGGIAFIGAGVAFLVVGLTNHDLLAFLGVGAAFLALGAANLAKAKKTEADKSGEGDA